MTLNGNGVNGHRVSRPLKAGIYAPIPTFFLPETEDLDIPSFETHVVRVAKAGVGPLICGSMGEGHHLTPSERVTLIYAARHALDAEGLESVPIIVGTGVGTTRGTVEVCNEAGAAGADAAIVICSGYFAGALDARALKAFWTEVAEKSPIPVMIYNYPGAAGGIDLDSNLIIELANECPNLCGVKLTCGNVGKLTRICSSVSTPAFDKLHPRKNPDAPFLVLGGFIDFLVPSAYVNAHGAITGLANVAPHAINKLYQLTTLSLSSDSTSSSASFLAEAQQLQGIIARADYTIAKASIAGTKYLLEKLYGYGGVPRKPLLGTSREKGEALWEHPDTVELVRVERELSGKIGA